MHPAKASSKKASATSQTTLNVETAPDVRRYFFTCAYFAERRVSQDTRQLYLMQ